MHNLMELSFTMAKILSGEKLAKSILASLKKRKKKPKALAVVQVGSNKVSQKYIAEKKRVAKDIGVKFQLVSLPKNVSFKTIESRVLSLSKDRRVAGIVVQLPLPSKLNTQKVLDLIPPEKDVDVLSSSSFAEFALGRLQILPPTVAAISHLLKAAKKDIAGKKAVVVGAGRLVGLPTAVWLAQQGAEVSLVQKETKNPASVIAKADIVVSGVGKPNLIVGSMIKKGAVVIDAGTSVEGAVTVGDVETESVSKKASFLSPVPGGVGPLTVACLLNNLYAIHR